MGSYKKGDLKNSFYDGIFAHMFGTLTGGVFLTGFALYLGMNDFMIGLLGSIPFLVTAFQIPASYFIIKRGKRKKLVLLGVITARLLWIPILIVAFLPFLSSPSKTCIIINLVFLSYTFISISHVSWLSWTSDLVPEKIRGRFFGTRNMLNGASGMLVLIIFGNFLDCTMKQLQRGALLGFGLTFLSAIILGMISILFISRISEPSIEIISNNNSFWKDLRFPFFDPNFKRFLIFVILWNFSVYFASPFFTLYFIRDLKFSYTFIATLAMISSFADLVGMQIWGQISDKIRNRAVIQFATWIAVFIPFAWATVRPGSLMIPVLLHIIGGGFWSGINLCMNNLLLNISHQENKALFLSTFNITAGLGAALGPLASGFILKSIAGLDLNVFSLKLLPLQFIFLTSTAMRLLSLQLFKFVHEPEAVSVGHMIRILRNIRGLNLATGFNNLLHPFIIIDEETDKSS